MSVFKPAISSCVSSQISILFHLGAASAGFVLFHPARRATMGRLPRWSALVLISLIFSPLASGLQPPDVYRGLDLHKQVAGSRGLGPGHLRALGGTKGVFILRGGGDGAPSEGGNGRRKGRWSTRVVHKLASRLGCIGLYLPRASKNAAEDLHRRYKAFYRSIPRRNAWQWLKLALGSILLLPVRLVAGFSLLISMWAACRLLSLGVKIGDQGLECEWRRVLLRGLVKRASRVLLFILGFYSIAQNGAVYEEGELCSQIIICNHVSYLDVLWALSYCAPAFVAKGSMAKTPLIGHLARCLGCIFVYRTRGEKGASVTADIVRRVNRPPKKTDPPILIFPEGTTTSGVDSLLTFKTGAFVAGKPVLPVVLRYPHCRGSDFNPSWESVSVQKHLFVLLSTWKHSLRVDLLPKCSPRLWEMNRPAAYAHRVELVMTKEMGLKTSALTLRDKFEYHQELKKHKLPEADAL